MEFGDTNDVVSLFSTPRRNFLIRNNHQRVKVDSLKGKIVGIYFMSLVGCVRHCDLELARDLKEVYDDLSPKNNFEVVLVAQVYDGDEREDKKLFDKLFKTMKWLAVPQDDKETRRKLFSMIGSKVPPLCTILDDKKRKIVNTDASGDIEFYGAECYPFTPERVIEIDNDDMLARASMSVKRFLTTPTRDFLIRSNSEKVPVSDLEGKVVAFYFLNSYKSKAVDILIELYETLQRRKKQFEIVLINSHEIDDNGRSYMQALKRTGWLGLPSKDRTDLKLKRIFRCTGGQLVIVAPKYGERTPDQYGLNVFRHYGIEAYPFTRHRVYEMEVERLKSLTLESILFSGRPCKYIESISKQKIYPRDLENKTILLLFTRGESSCTISRRLMRRLIKWYNETKESGVKEDFEIIHIPCEYDPPAEESKYGTLPWFRVPYDETNSERLFGITLDRYPLMPMIIAFGADGKILTMHVHCKFLSPKEWESEIDYPFTHADLFLEVKVKIASKMNWPTGVNLILEGRVHG